MAEPLTFEALTKVNLDRWERRRQLVSDLSPAEWLTCVMGEVGELAHLLEDVRHGPGFPLVDLREELADVVIYLDLLASRLGVNLGEAVRAKFNQDCKRYGYGGGL